MDCQNIRDKISLELVQVDVKGTVESQRCGDAGHDLSDEAIKIRERRRGNVKLLLAYVINGFVINHERAVGVFKSGVGGQDRVVGFDDRCRGLRSRVDTELELRLFTIIGRQSLHQQGAETGTSATFSLDQLAVLSALGWSSPPKEWKTKKP